MTMNKLIPRLVLFTTCFFCFTAVKAQYYYKDIVSHAQNLEKFSRLRKSKIASVQVTSYEANGEASEGFLFNQQLNSGYTQAKTIMEVPFSGRMSLTNFYDGSGQLYRTWDSGYQTFTVYEYGFDSLQRLVSILQAVQAIGDKTKTTENHYWIYNAKGFPEKMIRVKGLSDSSIIRLETDEQGRVLEEYPLVNGKAGDKTYYYYDSLGRMTDIVRFNDKAGKLIPDYMFDYYDNGSLRQMVTLEPGTLAQGTWIYLYDEKGLTTEEMFYNAQKKLAGRMAYQYQFRK